MVPNDIDIVSLDKTDSTASFNSPNVLDANTITVTGLTLSGTNASNYQLITPSAGSWQVADKITPAPLTGTVTIQNKPNDGTTVAHLDDTNPTSLSGNVFSQVGISDVVSLTVDSVSFDSPNVKRDVEGNVIAQDATANVTLTGAAASNYQLPGSIQNGSWHNDPISASAFIKPLAVTGNLTANDKTYDGDNVEHNFTYGDLTVASGVLIQDVDKVTEHGGSASFASKHVEWSGGAVVTQNVSASGSNLVGDAAGNYDLSAQPTTMAKINPLELTVTAVGVDKTYNGNATAQVTLTPTNLVAPDEVQLGYNATFNNQHVNWDATNSQAISKPVTINSISITAGSNPNDYAVPSQLPSDVTAIITQAPLTITANNASKVYGAAVPNLTASFSGFVPNENSSVLGTNFSVITNAQASDNVGGYYTRPVGYSDTDYAITPVDGVFTITKAALVV